MAADATEDRWLEAWLAAPWPALLRSPQGGRCRVNRCLAARLGVGCDELAAGQVIEESDHAALLQWDAPYLQVGSGAAVRSWERTRVELGGGWEAHYFSDVTEAEALIRDLASLENQVRQLEIKDPETGLLNRHAILHALDSQISRSRRYGNPLAAVVLRRGQAEAPAAMRQFCEELNSRLRWADQIGRLDRTGFLLVLPETNAADAAALAARLTESAAAVHRSVTEWQRGDDARKLLQRLGEAYP